MNLILLNDVRKVGHRGQLVTVADGYGMNYLIPRHLALQATESSLKQYEYQLAAARHDALQNMEKAKELLEQLAGKTLAVDMAASETGTLFKALHATDIAEEIKKQWGVEVPEMAVRLDHPIKHKGTYRVPVTIGDESTTVEVIA